MFLVSFIILAFGLCNVALGQNGGSSSNNGVQAFEMIEFSNVGFAGTYTPVKSLKNIDDSDCTCEVDDKVWFSGTNAPISDEVSVHFRGPLILHQFAYYVSSSFIADNNRTSSDWTRLAYYNATTQTADNVTFLTKAGDNSTCLGKALTYASSNGTSEASDATVLAEGTLITSDEEYVIFSNVSCPSSGTSKGCGVYRKGIPAFYGYTGVTKMFLFEFEMPTETQDNSTSFDYYDLPAIWLLNAKIPRTSQYPSNSNCSCWASGCGEFDIFEVMNGTEKNHLYSTFHTFQGIEDLGTGIQADGYISRSTDSVMRGGVIFDSNGDTVVFMSNDTVFDSTIDADTLNGILASYSTNDIVSTRLETISATAPSTTSKSNAASLFENTGGFLWYYIFTFFTSAAHIFLF